MIAVRVTNQWGAQFCPRGEAMPWRWSSSWSSTAAGGHKGHQANTGQWQYARQRRKTWACLSCGYAGTFMNRDLCFKCKVDWRMTAPAQPAVEQNNVAPEEGEDQQAKKARLDATLNEKQRLLRLIKTEESQASKEMQDKLTKEISELTAESKGLRPINTRLQASLQQQAAAVAEQKAAEKAVEAARKAMELATQALEQAKAKVAEIETQIKKDAEEAAETGLWLVEAKSVMTAQQGEDALTLLQEFLAKHPDQDLATKAKAVLEPEPPRPPPPPDLAVAMQEDDERKRKATAAGAEPGKHARLAAGSAP